MSLWHPSFEIISQKGTATTDSSGNASITFPVPFPTTPFIFIQAIDANAQGIVIDIVSKSNTGFSVKARKVTGMGTSSAGDHSHSFTPAGSVSVSSTDLGTKTSGTPSATKLMLEYMTTDYCDAGHSNCKVSTWVRSLVPTDDHTHTTTIGSHTHSASFSGSSGTTSTAGGHSHSVDAPVLSITFNWLAVV